MTDCEHEWGWIPQDCNEYGWHCDMCQEPYPGEPPGYSPTLDRSHTVDKVVSVQFALMDAGLVHFSNSSHGNGVTGSVVDWCRRKNIYDQYSITRRIFKDHSVTHAKFWKKIAKGVLTGNDKRKRCDCGALATSYCVGGKNYCSNCPRDK